MSREFEGDIFNTDEIIRLPNLKETIINPNNIPHRVLKLIAHEREILP